MKILHFADIHYGMENYGRSDPKTGLNSRLGDWDRSYNFMIDYAIKKNVDLVIFAGDAYKVRDPAPTYQRHFARGIYRLTEAQIPVVMITGNHDIPNALGKATSLDIFTALKVPHVLLATEPMFVEVDLSKHNPKKQGVVQFGLLPWLTKSQFLTDEKHRLMKSEDLALELTAKVGDYIDEFSNQINPAYPSFLVAHGSVEGAIFGSERSIMLGSDIVIPAKNIINSKFDYVALGHIHKHQTVIEKPATVYSGSLERIDFGEAIDGKGFVVINIENKKLDWQFIKVPARPFIVIKIRNPKSLSAQAGEIRNNDPNDLILKKINETDVKDAVVKVIIECDEEMASKILETPIREALQAGGADFIASIQKEIDTGTRIKIEQGFSDEIMAASPIDMLQKYFDSKKITGERAEKLITKANQLLDE